jgi:hypothetical protein
MVDARRQEAEAKPLRRLLVGIGQDVVVAEDDCGQERSRSPLTCAAPRGVCRRCYGVIDGRALVEVGAPIGMVAALALGAPLGSLGDELDRLRQLFEGRAPGGPAALVEAVLGVYCGRGMAVDRRHVEVLVARMMRFARVLDPGDTSLPRGAVVARPALDAAHRDLAERAAARDGSAAVDSRPARTRPLRCGLSWVVRHGVGWLAALLEDDPAKVLARAALVGARDDLAGQHARTMTGLLPGKTEEGEA